MVVSKRLYARWLRDIIAFYDELPPKTLHELLSARAAGDWDLVKVLEEGLKAGKHAYLAAQGTYAIKTDGMLRTVSRSALAIVAKRNPSAEPMPQRPEPVEEDEDEGATMDEDAMEEINRLDAMQLWDRISQRMEPTEIGDAIRKLQNENHLDNKQTMRILLYNLEHPLP